VLNTNFKKNNLGKLFSNKLLNEQEKFTLFFLNKSIFKKNKIDLKYKVLVNKSSFFSKNNSLFIKTRENLYDNYFDYVYRYVFFFYLKLKQSNNYYNVINNVNNITNIHFLRKERLYTKLKYSRSPAYDIVSGGAAALLAGFIGFLIQEKFGFELVDSGDFYYLFMYFVFLTFSIKPALTAVSSNSKITEIFNVSFILKFYFRLFYFFFKKKDSI
jgi:hypothetical protein